MRTSRSILEEVLSRIACNTRVADMRNKALGWVDLIQISVCQSKSSALLPEDVIFDSFAVTIEKRFEPRVEGCGLLLDQLVFCVDHFNQPEVTRGYCSIPKGECIILELRVVSHMFP